MITDTAAHLARRSAATAPRSRGGHDDELVTQMYFDGEPLNERDRFLQSVPPDQRVLLIAKLLPPPAELEPDSRLVIFDIVTLKG